MSAWVHGTDHIDLLVSVATRVGASIRPTAPEGFRDALVRSGAETGPATGAFADVAYSTIGPTDLGRLLLAENVASVRHAYDGVDETPEGVEYDLQVSEYHHRRIDLEATFGPDRWAVSALKAVSSYRYQSCEHPGWLDSDAKRWADALDSALLGHLPGWGEADTWAFHLPSRADA